MTNNPRWDAEFAMEKLVAHEQKTKPTLKEFRAARVSLKPKAAAETYCLEHVEFVRVDKMVHVYEIGDQCSYIIERWFQDGGIEFAWWFGHPCDDVEHSLSDAEIRLYDFLFAD